MRVQENTAFPLSVQASILIGSLVIAIAILISGGVIKLQGQGLGASTTNGATQTAQASGAPGPSANPRVSGVTAGNLPTLGNKNAKVLVVEFADYQCPFCEQFFSQSYPQLKADYIDTGKIQFAFR